jgi:chitin synthase
MRHVARTYQRLAVVLHLGDLDFLRDRARNEDAVVVCNGDVIDVAAKFLGARRPRSRPCSRTGRRQ